jgi:hypothetical protein
MFFAILVPMPAAIGVYHCRFIIMAMTFAI